MNPEVSAIICHHKGDFVHKAVASLKEQRDVRVEIIVITSDDDLASDGIHGVIVMNGPPMPAAKRNMGSRLASAPYLAFFDDDVEIEPDCLRTYLDAFVEPSYAMFYGKLWNMEHRTRFDEAGGFLTWTGFIWSRAQQNDVDRGQYDRIEPIFAGKSASCIIRKDVFDKVGGFDEDFGILGEESDLSWRVWLAGYQVLFHPMATGFHAFNTRFKPVEKFYTNDRVFYNGCRNYLTMLAKNLGREHLWILPIHTFIWFVAGCAMLVTGKFKPSLAIFRGLAYCILNLRLILTKRKEVQSERNRTDVELWPIISRSPGRSYYTERFKRYITQGLHG